MNHYLTCLKPFYSCIALLGLVLCTNDSQAQNYLDSFIITLEGDTIHGVIDHTEWNQGPDFIDFRVDGGEIMERYIPKNIAAFKIIDMNWLYVSRKVDIDVSYRQLDRLSLETEPKMKQNQELFLQVLVLGEVNLYYLRDAAEKQHFFIENEEISVQELSYFRYLKKDVTGNKNQLVEKEKYKGQLNYAMRGCKTIKKEIDRLNYEYTDFAKLFEKYNECIKGESLFFVNHQSKLSKIATKKYTNKSKLPAENSFVSALVSKRMDIGGIFGMTKTEIVFTQPITSIYDLDFEYEFLLTQGFFISRPLDMLNNRYAYQGELMLKTLRTDLVVKVEPPSPQTRTYTIRKFYAKTNQMMKIQPIDKRIIPYVLIGVWGSLALVSGNKLTIESGLIPPFTMNLWDGAQTLELGVIGAIGIQSPTLFLECRYEFTNGITSQVNDIDSYTRSFGIFVGVYLSELNRKTGNSRKNRHTIQQ